MSTFRKWIFQLFDENDQADHPWNKPISSFIMALIVLSIIAVVVESDADIESMFSSGFYYFEVFAVIIFTIEYIARIYTASLQYSNLHPVRAVIKYIFSPMAIVDFLAILPFYIELAAGIFGVSEMMDMRFIRVLRLMRLLRIFKLNRYNNSMKLIGDVLREEKEKLVITIFMTSILLVLSSAIVFTVEHEIQPDAFPNIYSSMWWAIATLTTVGYGDVYPLTAMGKILAGVIALLGIGLVALPTGILSGSFVQAINEQKAEKRRLDAMQKMGIDEEEKGFNYCPHCGEELPHVHK